jgi:shikimate kinase
MYLEPKMNQERKEKSNIILIGMPGSGKSTVGVILAKTLAKRFMDTDILLQNIEKRSLQDIVDNDGHMALRAVEQRVLLSIQCRNHIVATGGSAAYSDPAMMHLKKDGIFVFLHADLPALNQRIHNYQTRGLAKRPDQSFQDLFNERLALYEKYADITIASSNMTQDQVCDAIIDQLPKMSSQPAT